MECTGPQFFQALEAGSRWLEENVAFVNALNVFPVPDGDTGTNMALTMRSTLQAARDISETDTGSLTRSMAAGALLGARGNSGVILSQIIRGIAAGLANEVNVSGLALARALEDASQAAYRAMGNPVEGTILTVMKQAAVGGRDALAANADAGISGVLDAAVTAAKEAVENTPNLLPVLKEAGVVDSGGQGLSIILEGMLRYLVGGEYPEPYALPEGISTAWIESQTQREDYGFCTEFVVQGEGFRMDEVSAAMGELGDSEGLVGDSSMLRVHIHTDNPDDVLEYGRTLGELEQVSVRDMDQQHTQFLSYHEGGDATYLTGVVSVASGSGLADVMRSLGASAIVWGGQSMNPSTEDILNAVEAIPAPDVIVLPNNKNIVKTAEQTQSLTGKHIYVLPTIGIPEGIAALVSYVREFDVEENFRAMDEAVGEIQWGEITHTIRPTQFEGKEIPTGHAIGMTEGEIVTTGATADDALVALCKGLGAEDGGTLTIYYGADISTETVEATEARLVEAFPNLDIETAYGGQPHYPYIVSLE